MAYAITDFDNYARQNLDPTVINVPFYEKYPLAKFIPLTEVDWTGKALDLPIRVRDAVNFQQRAVLGNYADWRKGKALQWNLVDSDMTSFDVPLEVDTEALKFDDDTRVVRYFQDEVIRPAQIAWEWGIAMNTVCDQYGTRAVVNALHDSDGTTWSGNSATTQVMVSIGDGATDVGSLGRLRPGELVAIHSGSTATVRVYALVQEIRAADTIADSATKVDRAILSNTDNDGVAITQTSRSLGDNAADGHFANVADGDYIRSVNGVNAGPVARCPMGLDAYRAGTATIFGVNQATPGNGFAKYTAYSAGGSELSLDLLLSALEPLRYVMDPTQVGSVIRCHPRHRRTLMANAEAAKMITRMDSSSSPGLVALGYKGEVFNWDYGQLAFLADPLQNYRTIDIIPAGLIHRFTPAGKQRGDGFVADATGAISWQPKRAVSGSATLYTSIFETHRTYHHLMVNSLPQNVPTITNCPGKAYV